MVATVSPAMTKGGRMSYAVEMEPVRVFIYLHLLLGSCSTAADQSQEELGFDRFRGLRLLPLVLVYDREGSESIDR